MTFFNDWFQRNTRHHVAVCQALAIVLLNIVGEIQYHLWGKNNKLLEYKH